MSPDKRMKLRYGGTCRVCGTALPAQQEAIFERAAKTVRCVDCEAAHASEPALESATPVAGVAGASARREYERRKAKDEAKLREKWGRFGGVAVALSDERQSTNSWDGGAVGEEILGARLNGVASEAMAVLHDRRIPGSRANIDHLAVTGAGIWVIDAKRYRGLRPELRIEGGILKPRVEKLLVGNRDRTKLVEGVLRQVGLVREVVGDIPIFGTLCFVDADWPLVGGAFTTRGVRVLWPRRLLKMLATDENQVDVPRVCDQLSAHFRPA